MLTQLFMWYKHSFKIASVSSCIIQTQLHDRSVSNAWIIISSLVGELHQAFLSIALHAIQAKTCTVTGWIWRTNVGVTCYKLLDARSDLTKARVFSLFIMNKEKNTKHLKQFENFNHLQRSNLFTPIWKQSLSTTAWKVNESPL